MQKYGSNRPSGVRLVSNLRTFINGAKHQMQGKVANYHKNRCDTY